MKYKFFNAFTTKSKPDVVTCGRAQGDIKIPPPQGRAVFRFSRALQIEQPINLNLQFQKLLY